MTCEQAVQHLTEADEGFLYSSETDSPLEVFSLPEDYLSYQQKACRAVNVPVDTPCTEMTLDDFLGNIVREDGGNNDITHIRAVISGQLTSVKSYRIGKDDSPIFIVLIGQCSDGYAGIKTISVETWLPGLA